MRAAIETAEDRRREAVGLDGIPAPDFQRLVGLRFVVVAAEGGVVGIASLGLGMDLPLAAIATVVALQLACNLGFLWLGRQRSPIAPLWFFVSLVTDVVFLTALLYLAGGASNPFVSLLLAPLVVSAVVLPPRAVWGLAILCLVAYGLLLASSRPMPHVAGGRDFDWHVLGMGVGFVFVVLLIVFFVLHLAESLRRRDRALAEAREAALRDERLVALGTLAAGAAHELGTPLSTMAIVTRDLIDEVGERDPALVRRLELLRDQVDRCKAILSMIAASAGRSRADEGAGLVLDRFLESVLARWRGRLPGCRLRIDIAGRSPPPLIVADEGLRQAVVSLLDNAAGFSRDREIDFRARWDARTLWLEIADRGEGIAHELRASLGREPLTTRDDGHGLGIFMGRAVIERLGGRLEFSDREGGGTLARIVLPLGRLTVDD